MKPKIRDFFKQRKQDKNQNKYQLLAFPCVKTIATEENRILTPITREV